jgi:hypothetical protein
MNIEFIVARTSLSYSQRSIFKPESKHTGGARPSIHPQYEGDGVRKTSIFEEPIEQVVLILCRLNREGTRIHAREGKSCVPERQTLD